MIDEVQASLDEWKSARALLTTTLQSYLAACNRLTTTCTQPTRSIPERDAVEDAFVFVDSQLGALSSEIRSLSDSHISMCTLRNRSGRLTRINALPPEVLTQILLLANEGCLRNSRSKGCYNALSQVDVYWRQVALNTPVFWTHVDVSPDSPTHSFYDLSRMMLERSRGEKVHMHVFEPRKSSFGGPTPAVEIHKMKQFILPYITRVAFLDLETAAASPYLVESLVDSWSQTSGTMPLDLSIRFPNQTYPFYFALGGRGYKKHQKFKAYFRTLHLQNAVLNWPNLTCHGLVDLRLECTSSSHFGIGVEQLASILAASPALVTLKLCEVVLTEGGRPYTSPIVLNHLEVLNLVKLESQNVKLALPLISQPNPAAQLSVGLTFFDEGWLPEHRDFFARCHIATLYHESTTIYLSLSGIPLTLSHLVIFRSDLSQPPFILDAPTESQSRAILSVTLVSCLVTLEGLVSMVAEMGVQILNLDSCPMDRPMDLRGEINYVSEEMRSNLLQVYPNLVCNISEVDTAAHLPCRIVFEA